MVETTRHQDSLPGTGKRQGPRGHHRLQALDLVQLGTYTVNDKFTLFAYNTLSGTFDGLADEATFTDNLGGIWKIDYNDTTAGLNGGIGTNYVTVTAIPEPNVAALLGGLGTLMLLRRRRA